jgi:hypothetical protein
MQIKEKQNILIYLGFLVFIAAPLASYILTPSLIELYCNLNPTPWCGLGWAPIVYGAVFFAVFIVGSMVILITTALQKKGQDK